MVVDFKIREYGSESGDMRRGEGRGWREWGRGEMKMINVRD